MRNVVITGVGGLLGYHLAQRLIQREDFVYGIDCASNGFTEQLGKFPNFSFQIADVKSLDQMAKAVPSSINVIYHLAGQPAVWYANKHPAEDLAVNCLGTLNLLEIIREREKPKIVYASTGDIYGDIAPATEESIPAPNNFYGLSKLTAENYIRLYSRMFSIKYSVLRFALIYGPHQKRNIIFDVLKGLNSGTISLFTSLESEYDFVFIDDAVNALIVAAGSEFDNKTINIGNSMGIKTSVVVETILKLATPNKKVEIKVSENNIFKKILPNNAALALGWKPQFTFDSGMKVVWNWWSSDATKK